MVASSRTAVLASLADLMGISPTLAVALPTVVEVCASKAGLSDVELIDQAASNEALCQYMAGLCRIGAEALV